MARWTEIHRATTEPSGSQNDCRLDTLHLQRFLLSYREHDSTGQTQARPANLVGPRFTICDDRPEILLVRQRKLWRSLISFDIRTRGTTDLGFVLDHRREGHAEGRDKS